MRRGFGRANPWGPDQAGTYPESDLQKGTIMKSSDPKFAKACQAYCQGMADGKGSKELLKATGLSHSQADRAWYVSELNPKRVTPMVSEFAAMTEAEQNLLVLKMRADGESWGRISLTIGLPEGTTQTRFSNAAGIAAEGLRVGKGGRFLEDDGTRYVGNQKGNGVEDPKPRTVTAQEAAKRAEKKSVLPAKVKAAAKKAAQATKPVKADA